MAILTLNNTMQEAAETPLPADSRVWRYREHPQRDGEREGKLFNSVDDIPEGEGWTSDWANIVYRAHRKAVNGFCPHCGQPMPKGETSVSEPSALDFDGLSKESLVSIAKEAGVKIDARWNVEKIKQALRGAE